MNYSKESIRQPFWSLTPEESYQVLATRASGLDGGEVEARRAAFGSNQIPEERRYTRLRIILRQFQSPLVLILVAAGILTVVLGEWVEAAVIAAAVAVNTLLGFWQESKAETALEELKSYVRIRARVRRGGDERELDAVELVPGDIIRITQGDRVPADARLQFVNNLEVDEAILTGESLPVGKRVEKLSAGTPLPERVSMVFSGTLVAEGFGDAVVTAIGGDTELGQIAQFVGRYGQESTPLQRAIGTFAKRSGIVLTLLAVALFATGLGFGYRPFDMFLIAVAVAVAAVPEGLPIALTVILAVGVSRIAKRRGVVRRLLAAETLGSTTLILTDKTGTLTQARMDLSGTLPYSASPEHAREVLRRALLNTDAVIENPRDLPSEWRMFGRPLERALVRGAAAAGVLWSAVAAESKVVDRLPFNSQRKFSAALVETHGRRELTVLGAPELILAASHLRPDEHARLLGLVERRASAGERVVAVAWRGMADGAQSVVPERDLKYLRFEGFLTFRDPLRPHVGAAIRRIRAAGVRTVIVTGDHQGTAEAVARELGLVDGNGAVLAGSDLPLLSPEEWSARGDAVSVYARVSPEQKVEITRHYQKKGEVVAVTGDGVNDAPALEAADIGIAVGSGTDVAKAAADLVVLDDNFETIVSAIDEGRKILDNIRKVIVYLLSDVLDEMFLIGGALLAGITLPLNALQILFVNFFSDSFPAVAFAFERGVDGAGGKPRRLGRGIFDRTMKFLIFVIGILTSAFLFILYLLLLRRGFPPDLVRTFIFGSFASYTLFLSFALRSLDTSILRYNPFGNPYLTGGVLVGLTLTALVIYLPFLQVVFGTVALPAGWLLSVLGVGILNVALVEFGKWLFRARRS